MTTEQIIGLTLALLLMGIGAVGSLLHVLPGAVVVLLVAVGHRLYFGAAGTSTWALVILAGLALSAMVADLLAGLIGARVCGATRRGMCGAVAGGLVGLLFRLPGLLLGPLLGAFLLERSGNRPARQAAKAGLGAGLGFLLGGLANFACCLVMIALFLASVLFDSYGRKPAELMSRLGFTSRVCAVRQFESLRSQQNPALSCASECAKRNAQNQPAQAARRSIFG